MLAFLACVVLVLIWFLVCCMLKILVSFPWFRSTLVLGFACPGDACGFGLSNYIFVFYRLNLLQYGFSLAYLF